MTQIIPKEALRKVIPYTRETFLQEKGSQAPAFNPDKPVKLWTVESGGQDYYYKTWDLSGEKPLYVERQLTSAEARAVNIPGPFVYPRPNLAPSGAFVLEGPNNSKRYLPADTLSTIEQAQLLAHALGQFGWSCQIAVNETSGIYTVQYESHETRKTHILLINGAGHFVGTLLAQRNENGVGAPGEWSKPSESASPIWRTKKSEENAVQPNPSLGEVPFPMRDLVDGESWRKDNMAGWIVIRGGEEPPALGGGSVDLSPIDAKLDSLSKMLAASAVPLSKLVDDIAAIKADVASIKAVLGI